MPRSSTDKLFVVDHDANLPAPLSSQFGGFGVTNFADCGLKQFNARPIVVLSAEAGIHIALDTIKSEAFDVTASRSFLMWYRARTRSESGRPHPASPTACDGGERCELDAREA